MSDAQATDASPTPSTADHILDVAQEKIQQCGYSAVSYSDLAGELDLTTAAIHYHFPSKADLGRELVARYRRANAEKRSAIQETTEDLRERLEQYVSLYASVFDSGGVCLCGVLAANESALPAEVHDETQRFFEEQEDWLTQSIDADPSASLPDGHETPRQVAELLLAAIEGALITKRARGTTAAYEEVIRRLIDAIAP